MDMDKGRNCYNCREFGYIVRHCKEKYQRRVRQGRRANYENNRNNNNLNGEELN